MKKIFVPLLVLSLLSLLVSQGFAAGAKEKKAEPAKLVMWWWGEQDEPGIQKWMDETVALYQKQHPNVAIEAVLQSTDQLIPAFQTAAQSRTGPDIQFFWAGIWTMMNVFNGYLSPISDYWTKEELSKLPYQPEVTYQGKVWCAAFYNTIAPLIYNTAVFEKAGLDAAAPPRDWGSFLDACEKIKAAGYIPIALGNKSDVANHTQWLEAPLAGQYLDKPYDYLNVFASDIDYKEAKYSDWWNKLAELWEKGYINSDVNSLDLAQAMEDLFASGKAAMTIAPGGAFRKYSQILHGSVGIMDVPVFGSGSAAGKANVWRKNWGITDWSKNKETAADLLRTMASAERSNAFYKACGAFPGSLNFDPAVVTDKDGIMLYKALQKSFDGTTNSFIPAFVDTEGIWGASQKLFSGEYSAADAIDHVARTIAKWKKEDPEGLKSFRSWAGGMK